MGWEFAYQGIGIGSVNTEQSNGGLHALGLGSGGIGSHGSVARELGGGTKASAGSSGG